ncbi:MAG: hypothetical protein JWR18_3322 [Segetibacter sp.]|jgi:hypothetical protein|nr:hypothetical protein [Segetibacter sp.]
MKVKTKTFTIEVLTQILPHSNMDEVRKISLQLREEAQLYQPNELIEMLIRVSDRLIELCGKT